MVRVTSNRKSHDGLCGHCSIQPGENEVPDEAWAKVAKHPDVVERVKRGEYVVRVETPAKSVPPPVEPAPPAAAAHEGREPSPEPADDPKATRRGKG